MNRPLKSESAMQKISVKHSPGELRGSLGVDDDFVMADLTREDAQESVIIYRLEHLAQR